MPASAPDQDLASLHRVFQVEASFKPLPENRWLMSFLRAPAASSLVEAEAESASPRRQTFGAGTEARVLKTRCAGVSLSRA